MKKISIEEHFATEAYIDYLRSRRDVPKREFIEDDKGRKIELDWWTPSNFLVIPPKLTSTLCDLGEGRLRDMDESGIDMQVLSLSFPGVESFDAADAKFWAKSINDELSEVIKKHPERFAGFATLASQDPDAAAIELERAVKDLGLKGASINSHIRGEYLDDQKYWVIFEKAEKLAVPIYLHPRQPSPDMIKPYLAYPDLPHAMLGFAAEVSLHAMRLICSGVFDKYPNLKIILGHLGEALPFWLWRQDNMWNKLKFPFSKFAKQLQKTPSQYFKDNFFVTTSGMFWQPVLQFVYSVLGADRILFAVDYPHESNRAAVQCMEAMPICSSDKEKLYHLNAETLLAL